MKHRKLTASGLASLPEGDHLDAYTPGLMFRVGRRRRAWALKIRARGQRKQIALGFYPVMGLSDARKAADEVVRRLDQGAPITTAPPVHPRSAAVVTMGVLLDKYEAARERQGYRTKSLAATMRSLRKFLADFRDVPASEFSKRDLRSVRDGLNDAGKYASANLMLRSLGPVMAWASERDIVATNIVRDLKKNPNRKRTRILSDDELRAIWHAAGTMATYGKIVRFLMVTGQRRGEVVALKHGDIVDGVWRMLVNKSDRPHRVPLSTLALDLVGKGEAQAYVFEGLRGGCHTSFMNPKVDLDKKSGVSGWCHHDLRRTLVSRLADMNCDEMTIRSVVNHSIVSGALSNYLHTSLEAQKRQALQDWSDRVEALVKNKKSTSAIYK